MWVKCDDGQKPTPWKNVDWRERVAAGGSRVAIADPTRYHVERLPQATSYFSSPYTLDMTLNMKPNISELGGLCTNSG